MQDMTTIQENDSTLYIMTTSFENMDLVTQMTTDFSFTLVDSLDDIVTNDSLFTTNTTIIPTTVKTVPRRNLIKPIIIDVYNWGMFILPVMAVICNGLSIAVFMQRRFSKAAVSSFLIALAVCDTLANSMNVYMSYSRVGLWSLSTLGCKISIYITAVSRMSAIWLNVFFTAERFISVRYVFKRDQIITPFRIKACVAILVCCMLVEESFILVWMSSIPPYFCFTKDVAIQKKYLTTLLILNRVVNFLVPLTLVTVMNSLIVFTVRKSSQIHGKSLNSKETGERRLTIMLVLVSTLTFILVIPETTAKIMEVTALRSLPWLPSFGLMSDMISYLSHSCNFFFYVLAGTTFRNVCIDMLTCRSLSKEDKRRSSFKNSSTAITTASNRELSFHDIKPKPVLDKALSLG